MKMTYTDLLGEYITLLDNQPDEVKETIALGQNYKNDLDIQAVLDFLSKGETQYKTYSHS